MLVEFLKGHYASIIESRKALLEHGEIRFDLLWTLFPPNTIVYTESYEHNLPRCLRLNWSEERRVKVDHGPAIDVYHIHLSVLP